MKLSAKARKSLNTVVERLRAGDLGPLVDVAVIDLDPTAPAARWTYSNRVLAYAQTGSADCRGYRQWQEVGRQVQKGQRASYILAPRIVTEEKDGEKKKRLVGWLSVPVFGLEQTEGEDVDAYAPKDPPPLLNVARALGLAVTYGPILDRLGSYNLQDKAIKLYSHNIATFFHELAHACHDRLDPDFHGGQDAHQETVAELTAAVLMHLYGLGDYTGNAWPYIKHYNEEDPLNAVTRALADVEKVIDLIETLGTA